MAALSLDPRVIGVAEALRDDIVAVEAGVHRLLPLADAFGRRIMFIEPHRHTRRGYSSESLVSLSVSILLYADLAAVVINAAIRSIALFDVRR